MEKTYEAKLTAAEASRILITFAARAYVWATDRAIMAETLSGRKMVLVNLAMSSDYALIIDENLFGSECFWAEAFLGLEKYRFSTPVEVDWAESVFDTSEAELIGDTSPMSFNDEDYLEPDYGDICRRMEVTTVDFDAEKAEEIKALQPLVDAGTISDYDAECVALAICNRIDRGDLKDPELREARISAVVDRKKWDILAEFERQIGEKFPTPPTKPRRIPRKPQKAERDPGKPRRRKQIA